MDRRLYARQCTKSLVTPRCSVVAPTSCAPFSTGCRRPNRNQAKAAIRAAWRLEAKDGQARLKKLAEWYAGDWPEAAASLREGLEECFTINRLGLPPSLHRCLATTNIVESPNAGVRRRTRRVTRWKDASMVRRWAAAAFLDTEKNFRKIMGYKDLWVLMYLTPRRQVHKHLNIVYHSCLSYKPYTGGA